MTSTNMTHNSRKTHQLLVNGRGNMTSTSKRPVQSPATEGDTFMVYPFSEEEYIKGVALQKTTKPLEEMMFFVEQLKNIGSKAHRWLLAMINKMLNGK